MCIIDVRLQVHHLFMLNFTCMDFHNESQVYLLFFFEKVHISASASVEFQIWLGNDVGLENDAPLKLNLGVFVISKGQLKKHRL